MNEFPQARTMVARVSADDIVIYANAALAAYLEVTKAELIGAPLEIVSRRCMGEIAECFQRPEDRRTTNRLVTDDKGRVFEAKTYSEGGILDIVLDEVTTAEAIGRELHEASGTPVRALNEEELRTARHPERRYLTITYTRLCGLGQAVERLAPMEGRLMVASFIEEASDAIFETGCSVGETLGDAVLGIYGAPRYFADHTLRSVRAACDQVRKLSQLRRDFFRGGRELPPSSCGIWTGDVLIGTVGNSAWQHYTALGAPVEFAEKLSRLARAGEVLLPEHTLLQMLRNLPNGWQHIRAESEEPPDMSGFAWPGDEVGPVSESLRKVVYLIGPDLVEHPEQVEYYFDYLFSLRVSGFDDPVSILRVVRPEGVGDSFELRDDNIVAARTVQILGKYKLFEVVGTGGMGKVWRGIDRFGNAVAIKVLYNTEGSDRAMLKRFRREAEIMARLPHRNICRVFEMSEFEDVQFIAMEYVDGLTLADLLYEKTSEESAGMPSEHADLKTLIRSLRDERSSLPAPPPQPPTREGDASVPASSVLASPRQKVTRILPVEQTLGIFLKVCDAVQFAHEHGVLHRDLKPGNILLREDGEPLVADFGLAKWNSADSTASLSLTGHVVGTMENMSPEQAESSKSVDERADVYSLGTILYQMLSGRRHFDATGNIVSDAQALKAHTPVRPRVWNPKLDPDLEIITLKALRAEPSERYRNVEAFRADIERFRRGEVISAKPVSYGELIRKLVQRNKTVSLVIGVSSLIFTVTLVTFLWLLNAQLQYARQAESIANEQTKLAGQRAAEAKRQTAIAEEQMHLAQEAYKLKQQAEDAADRARQAGEQARRESDESRKARLAAEDEARKKQEELAAKELELASLQAAKEAEPPAPESPAGVAPGQIRVENEILAEFNLGLSSEFLATFQDPEELYRRVTFLLDKTSRALATNPDFFPGWMIKGRLHLALREQPPATAAFARAAIIAKNFPADLEDKPERMQKLLEDAGTGDDLPAALRKSDLRSDAVTLALLQKLESRPSTRRTTGVTPPPASRVPTDGETLLNLALANPGPPKILIDETPGGDVSVTITDSGDLKDLSALKSLRVTNLALRDAQTVDWANIGQLGIQKLDISETRIASIPTLTRGFLQLREFDAEQSSLTSIEFAQLAPQLDTMKLANSRVADLSPLAKCRRLLTLDISGLNPANLRILAILPINSLTLSPELITDKAALSALRSHRTLKALRAPGDPPALTATEFWRKLDAGGYAAPADAKTPVAR